MREWYRRQSKEKKQAMYAARDKKKARAADRRRNQKPARKKAIADRARQWAEDHPAERKAQVAVGNAIRDCRLQRGTVCEEASDECEGRIEAHHDDYEKPLEVRWLCAVHHGLWHAENGSAAGATVEA
mgnify:FL=1